MTLFKVTAYPPSASLTLSVSSHPEWARHRRDRSFRGSLWARVSCLSQCLAPGWADSDMVTFRGHHNPPGGKGRSPEEWVRRWEAGRADPSALQALSTDSVERLPVYNKSAWRHYQTIQEAGDWCVPSTEPKNTSTYRVS